MHPLEPITLEGNDVRLEPLTVAHEPELRVAVQDGRLWATSSLGLRDAVIADSDFMRDRRRLPSRNESM